MLRRSLTSFICLALLTWSLGIASPGQAQTNLLNNSDFESFFLEAPFLSANNGTITVKKEIPGVPAHGGIRYLAHTATGEDSYTTPHTGNTGAVAPAAEGEQFTFSIWAQVDFASLQSAPIQAHIFCLDASYASVGSNTTTAGVGTNWQQISVAYACPVNSAYVSVRIDNDAFANFKTPVTVYWDDASLVNSGGLVAHLSFEEKEGSLTVDQTGNGHDGTFPFEMEHSPGALVGGARRFDGTSSQFVRVAAHTDLELAGDYTLSAWVFPEPNSLVGVKGIMGLEGDGYGMSLVNGRANFGRHGCGNFSANTLLEAYNWYHLTGVFRANGDEELYLSNVDGIVEVKVGSLSEGNCNGDQNDLVIGKHRTGPTENFIGWIDEIKLYNIPFTASQVLTAVTDDRPGEPTAATPPLDTDGFRGLVHENAFSTDQNIDNVNTMTGNLVQNIPIGQRYQAGPNFEWGLNLVNNSNCWDVASDPPDGGVPDNPNVFIPMYTSNAGACWKVDLGQLFRNFLPPATVSDVPRAWPNKNVNTKWMYIDQTGSRVYFEHASGNTYYSLGGTFVRLTDDEGNGKVTLEFSDGIQHTFRSFSGQDCEFTGHCMRLDKMEDRFGNDVNIKYLNETSNNPKWEITDAYRTVTINFSRSEAQGASAEEGDLFKVIDDIRMAAFDGTTASWNFVYQQKPSMLRGCNRITNTPRHGDTTNRHMSLPLLSRVVIPGSNTGEYSFTTMSEDFIGPDVVCNVGDMRPQCAADQVCHNLAGKLDTVTLPAKSKLHYDWGLYSLPTSCSNLVPLGGGGGEEGPDTTESFGVIRREVQYAGGSVKSWTNYEQNLGEITNGQGLNDCHRAHLSTTDIVHGPAIEGKYPVTRQFHAVSRTVASIDDVPSPGDWTPQRYGLAINPSDATAIDPGSGDNFSYNHRVYLSKEEAACNNPQFSTGSCTVHRRTYLNYALRPGPASGGCVTHYDKPECGRRDTQMLAQRQTFGGSSKWIDTEYSEYDGLGHFRVMNTTSNFDHNTDQRTKTNFNPGLAAVSIGGDGYILGNSSYPSTWLLNLWDRKEIQQDGKTKVQKFTFDAATGFLRCARSLKNTGASPADNSDDLAVYYTANTAGYTVWEEHRGGDGPTNASCSAGVASEYVIQNTYQYGQLQTSRYHVTQGGAAVGPLLVDNTIDLNTGLVRRACDNTVNPKHCADFEYDAVSRLTRQSPGQLADTAIVYELLGGGGGGKVTLKNLEGVTVLDEAEFTFDAFGRETKARTKAAPGWLRRDTAYDANDLKISQSTLQADSGFNSGIKTTFGKYDIHHRVGEEINAENDLTRFVYPSNGRIDSVSVERRIDGVNVRNKDYHDNLQRVVLREEGTAVSGGNPIRRLETLYNGNTVELKMQDVGAGTFQRRYSLADGRDFTYSEKHPEQLLQPSTHEYDAMGHLTKKVLPGGGVTLHSQYDDAARLTRIYDNNGKTLKDFSYNALGRLHQSIRHNYLTSANTFGQIDFLLSGDTEIDLQVIEYYTYNNKGLLATKTTTVKRVGNSATYSLMTSSQSWTYDALGNVATVSYPSCSSVTGCVSSGAPARTLSYTYVNGDLETIKEGGVNLIKQEYHGNRMLKKVLFYDANGAVATQDVITTVGANGRGLRRIKSIEIQDGSGATIAGTGDYTYDDSGNIISIGTNSVTYDYDRLSRLTVSGGAGNFFPETFSYDAFDNQLSPIPTQFGVDQTSNRLTNLNNLPVTYDTRGNLTDFLCYEVNYDALDYQLAVQCSVPAIQPYQYQGLYLYNAQDERVLTLDRIPYDPAQVPDGDVQTLLFLVRDQNGKILREFRSEEVIPGGGTNWTYKDYVWGGSALRSIYNPAKSTKPLHVHADHLGSVRVLTVDSTVHSGDVYSAFGRGQNTLGERIGFSGHEMDRVHPGAAGPEELEGAGFTYNMVARGYFPTIGRFMRPDPVRDGWNLYAYAGNNPINRIDPTGLSWMPPFGPTKIPLIQPPAEAVTVTMSYGAAAGKFVSLRGGVSVEFSGMMPTNAGLSVKAEASISAQAGKVVNGGVDSDSFFVEAGAGKLEVEASPFEAGLNVTVMEVQTGLGSLTADGGLQGNVEGNLRSSAGIGASVQAKGGVRDAANAGIRFLNGVVDFAYSLFPTFEVP